MHNSELELEKSVFNFWSQTHASCETLHARACPHHVFVLAYIKDFFQAELNISFSCECTGMMIYTKCFM